MQDNHHQQTPFGTYLAVMFLLTYAVIALGVLVIACLIIVGLAMEFIYERNTLSTIAVVLLAMFGLLALLTFLVSGINMWVALKKDFHQFNLKKAYPSYQTLNHHSVTKTKNIIYNVLISLLFSGIGIFALNSFISIIPRSGSDITALKILWMTLTVACFSVPLIVWAAFIKILHPKQKESKFAVSSLFMTYINFIKKYEKSTKVDEQIKTYQNGFRQRYEQVKRYSEQLQQEPQPLAKLNDEINFNLNVTEQGRQFAESITSANELIPDAEVTNDLNVICEYVGDIFALAAKDHAIEHQIRKFTTIYLPQTLKLCNLYIDLDSKQMQTQKVEELKSLIAKSIKNTKLAFSNFNDNLFRQSSINIEAEIKTFEHILTMDGLLNNQEIMIPE